MIVLLSYSGDQIANDVMEWLQVYGCNYKRVNLEEEDFRKLSVTLTNGFSQIQLELQDGSSLNPEEVSIFFFRGGLFNFNLEHYKPEGLSQRMIRTHLSSEYNTLVDYFYNEISKKCLGNPLLSPLNKLQQLQMAAEVGLGIPETFIRNSESAMAKIDVRKEPIWISKSIQENVLVHDAGPLYHDLKVGTIKQSALPEQFFPSLFQYPVEKAVEVRTFYLDGRFYSLAMLLDRADEPVIDYRKVVNKLRYARYKLPLDIEIRLKCFMKKMNLNTGSIDLLFDNEGTCYFLEVNPTGQIGWVSDDGNYFLEEKIARYLIYKDLNFRKV
jgi:hypothetical protein